MVRIITSIVLALTITSLQAAEEPKPPTSFNSAKKFLADLHEEIGHLETIYCGCPYKRTPTSGGRVDREACGLVTRSNETRSKRVEWEHVVPASWFGQPRACWALKETAYPECVGKSGRKCCEDVNTDFDLAHNDPNNLFPSSGEVNADRSNHPYGLVDDEPRVYGQCDAELMAVPTGGKVFEPAEGKVRGIVARAMLYMAQVYGADVRLPMETVWEWHTENPPEEWEVKRAQLIADRTGLRNSWVLGFVGEDH